MKDNFDLKKFLTENKTIEKSNPHLKESYDEFQRGDKGSKGVTAKNKSEEEIFGAGVEAGEHDALRKKIREMIVNELSEDIELEEESLEEVDTKKLDDKIQKDPKLLDKVKAATEKAEKGDSTDLAMLMAMPLEEAKEDEEEEVETEETEEVETEETEETESGLEDIAADMEGNEGDLMNHLMSALKVSKGMDNEKLTTQIGNTLKFFVGEYIGGEE